MRQPRYPRRRTRRTRTPKKPPSLLLRWGRPLLLLIIAVLGLSVIIGTVVARLNRPAPPVVTTPTPTPIANTVVLKQEITPLTQKIKQLIAKPDIKVHLLIYDVDTNAYVDIDGSSPLASASLIKMPLLIAFLEDLQAQTISLTETLQFTEDVKAGEAGSIQDRPIGTKISAQEVVTLMITESDNTATNMILKRLGGIETVNNRFKEWGLQQTRFRSLLPDLQGTNTTSPRELVELLARVEQQQLLSLRGRDLFMDIMSQTRNGSLLRRGLPDSTRIRHKTGTLAGIVGDTGIIDTPSGKRYLIAVIVRRPPNDPAAEELIGEISKVTFTHFMTDSIDVAPITPAPSP